MKLSVKKKTKLKKLAKQKPIIKRIRIKFDREKIEGEITKNFIL
jgi:hypothetical protein